MELWWILTGGAAAVAGGVALAWRPVRSAMREKQYRRARADFHLQRERLEARFLTLASQSGRPRGLRWTDCDFEDAVAYARDRKTRHVTAFVGVTISFEAVAGGPMEGVEAVGNLRAATAVFHFRNAHWETEGRAVFNLNPTEAIAYYHDDFEMIGQEAAQRT